MKVKGALRSTHSKKLTPGARDILSRLYHGKTLFGNQLFRVEIVGSFPEAHGRDVRGELVNVPDADESLNSAQPPEADIIILDPPSRPPQGMSVELGVTRAGHGPRGRITKCKCCFSHDAAAINPSDIWFARFQVRSATKATIKEERSS